MSTAAGTAVGIILPILAILALPLGMSVKWVPRDHARNVMRQRKNWWGPPMIWPADRFLRTLGPGLHMVIPGLDSVGSPIDLREQAVSLTGQRVVTADGQAVNVDTLVSFRVTNPRPAAEAIGDPKLAIERFVSVTLLGFIGRSDLAHVLASRDNICAQLREKLDEISGEWGIRVSRAEIRSIVPGPEATETGETRPLPAGSNPAVAGRRDELDEHTLAGQDE